MSHTSLSAKDDCQARLVMLGDYIEGLLDEATCAELEEHLASCPDCRVVVNSLTNTIELFRCLPPVQLSHTGDEHLMRVLKLDLLGNIEA